MGVEGAEIFCLVSDLARYMLDYSVLLYDTIEEIWQLITMFRKLCTLAVNSIPHGKLAQQVSAQDTQNSSSFCYRIRHRKRCKDFVVSCSTVLFFILVTPVLPSIQPSTSFLNE